MNCCNANGKCTGRRNCAGRESQPMRFAPGTVESYRRPLLGTPLQRRDLARWLLPSLAFTAVTGLAGLAAGLISGWLS